MTNQREAALLRAATVSALLLLVLIVLVSVLMTLSGGRRVGPAVDRSTPRPGVPTK